MTVYHRPPNSHKLLTGQALTINQNTLWLILLLIFSLVSADNIGGYAGGFLRIGTTARSLAMGGGLTAAIDNGFAANNNPASLAFIVKRRVTVLHHFLPMDRFFVSSSFATHLPPSAGVGLALIGAGVDNIDGRDGSGQHTKTLSTSEYAAYISFANELIPGISIGINVKVLYHTLVAGKTITGKGTGIDVGLLIHRFEKLDLGIVLQDFNAKYAWNTSKLYEEKGGAYEEKFPMQIRLGFSYHPGIFEVNGDYTFFYNGDVVISQRLRAGGEYQIMKEVAIRAGIDNFLPAVGGGINYSLLKRDDTYVDYALRLGRAGEGLSHIFTYVFTF